MIGVWLFVCFCLLLFVVCCLLFLCVLLFVVVSFFPPGQKNFTGPSLPPSFRPSIHPHTLIPAFPFHQTGAEMVGPDLDPCDGKMGNMR